MKDLAELSGQIGQSTAKVVEQKLVERLEQHLGRVPSNDEVARCSERWVGWPDAESTAYFWSGYLLFSYRTFFKDGNFSIEIKWPTEPEFPPSNL